LVSKDSRPWRNTSLPQPGLILQQPTGLQSDSLLTFYKHTPNSSSPVRITTSSMCVQCIHKFCCKSNWVWLYAYLLLQQIKLGIVVCRHSVAAIELGMIVCIYSSVANQNWVYDCMIAYDCFEKRQGWDCGPGFAPAVHNFQQQLKAQHTCSSSLSAHSSSNSRINQPSQQLSLQKEMGCSLSLCSKNLFQCLTCKALLATAGCGSCATKEKENMAHSRTLCVCGCPLYPCLTRKENRKGDLQSFRCERMEWDKSSNIRSTPSAQFRRAVRKARTQELLWYRGSVQQPEHSITSCHVSFYCTVLLLARQRDTQRGR
jgi:hypothetical protein